MASSGHPGSYWANGTSSEITTFTGKGVQSESIILRIPQDKAAEIGQALIDLSKEK
jgi:hypothetical protein